jgi:serine/threonine protein kinase
MKPLPTQDQDSFLRIGEVIAGKYQIEDVLGTGGMGVVVSAMHVVLHQRVAMKFLLPSALQLPDAPERFKREAQAAAAIRSEHVARVQDVGTLDTGVPYIVMEYLSGIHFGKLLKLRGGSLSHIETIDLVLQACEAIAEAHGHGIVHRDLKLTNLFLTTGRDGSPLVKVLDFGLSKMLSTEQNPLADDGITDTNLVIGSPYYMSPEQVRSLKHVDARTDIWSLGVILYQLITGRRPFSGENFSTVCIAIAVDVPPSMQSIKPHLPAGLNAVVSRCLEKDVNRRMQSVAELAHGLAPFASDAALRSIERIIKIASGGPTSATGPRSGITTVSLPPPSGPEPPKVITSVLGPTLSLEEHRDFLPWLRNLDEYLRTHRARVGVDEKTAAELNIARTRLDETVRKVGEYETLLKDIQHEVDVTQATLLEAERTHNAAKEQLSSALEVKQQTFERVVAMLRPVVSALRSHVGMTKAMRCQLGLESAPVSAPRAGSIVRPSDLAVVPHANNVNLLRWSVKTNERGTQFLIEAAIGTIYRGVAAQPPKGAYKLLASVTDVSSYIHNVGNVPSGVIIKYRVRAMRGSVFSEYSNEASVTCL